MNYIICGIDRLGKGTLIQNILNDQGYHTVLHYDKPKALTAYGLDLKRYQQESFEQGFEILKSNDQVIMDRFHIGESVYCSYRGYIGDYIFDMEAKHIADLENTVLVLLTTSDFSFIEDDGESFDFDSKEEEQLKFIESFNRSGLNKIMIDICADGTYRPSTDIYTELQNNLRRTKMDNREMMNKDLSTYWNTLNQMDEQDFKRTPCADLNWSSDSDETLQEHVERMKLRAK